MQEPTNKTTWSQAVRPVKPMLAKLEPQVFNRPDYIWEPKLDGIRAVVVVDGAYHKIQARSGTDKTGLFPLSGADQRWQAQISEL